MKKACILFMLISAPAIFAQGSFGVKAGLNYGDNGKIEFSDATNVVEDTESRVGYHLGVYYKAGLGGFYLKPELLYTETKSIYDYNDENAKYSVQKLDLPVLLGIGVIGPLDVFAGPSFQYILDNELEGVTIGDVENEFTVGVQFGVGVELGGVALDVRYERGLSENSAELLDVDDNEGRIDTRPNQFIVSLALDL